MVKGEGRGCGQGWREGCGQGWWEGEWSRAEGEVK